MYANGMIPLEKLIHLGGNHYLPPGTAARWNALVAAGKSEFGVTLRITPDRDGLGGWNGYRPLDAQRRYKAALGSRAAAPGSSSHGGTYRGQEAFAIDVDNWEELGWEKFSQLARSYGFTVDFVSPREPWHIGDFNNAWSAPVFGHVTVNPNTTNKPVLPEEEDDDMKMKGAYWTAGGKTVYMLFNEVSGFHVEHSGVEAGYNNEIAKDWETNSWAPITESHAKVLITALDKVRTKAA